MLAAFDWRYWLGTGIAFLGVVIAFFGLRWKSRAVRRAEKASHDAEEAARRDAKPEVPGWRIGPLIVGGKIDEGDDE